MRRTVGITCQCCGKRWVQDWEEPDCCPVCGWPDYEEEEHEDEREDNTDSM